MEKNSIGTAGRTALITLDYKKGFINQHEEIFALGKDCGIFERPNNQTFIYEGVSYRGKNAMANAIKEDPDLGQRIVEQAKMLDQQ